MIKRRFGLFLAVFVLTGDWAHGQTVGLGESNRFEFELRRWRPRFRSELKVDGDSIDPKEDLGLTDPRDFEYKGFVRFGRWVKIRGSGAVFNFESTATLRREITYAGVTFPEATTVSTNMDLRFIKGGVEVDVYAFREGFVAVMADYAVFEAEPTIGVSEARSSAGKLEVKLPTVGLKTRLYLTPALALTVEGEGMKKDDTGVITDFEGVVTYNLGRSFAVSFGYRNLYAKWLKDGRATFRLEGYFFSGAIRI